MHDIAIACNRLGRAWRSTLGSAQRIRPVRRSLGICARMSRPGSGKRSSSLTSASRGARRSDPALDRLLREVQARRIDVVVVAAFDRFSRSVRHLVETLELFRHLGVEFVSLREQIDTGSPLGQAVFTIVAAIAELERSLIAERVRAGLRRARAEGRRLGRPPVTVDPGRLASVIRRNVPVREAARQLGISASTYHRLVRAQATALGKGAVAVSGHPATTDSRVSETLAAEAV